IRRAALMGRRSAAAEPAISQGHAPGPRAVLLKDASELPADRQRRTPVVPGLAGRRVLAVEAVVDRERQVEVAHDLALRGAGGLETNAAALGEARKDLDGAGERHLWKVVHEVGVPRADHRLGAELACALDGFLVGALSAGDDYPLLLVLLEQVPAHAEAERGSEVQPELDVAVEPEPGLRDPPLAEEPVVPHREGRPVGRGLVVL